MIQSYDPPTLPSGLASLSKDCVISFYLKNHYIGLTTLASTTNFSLLPALSRLTPLSSQGVHTRVTDLHLHLQIF